MNTHFDNYYQCGDKTFYNIYQAFAHQKSTGHLPLYKIDQGLIDSISNFKRPANLSVDYIRKLMVSRLKEIRRKYNKMKLPYSGGTDSYTLLKLCMDNDIYVDEIVTQVASITKNVRTDLESFAGFKSAKKWIAEGKLIGKHTIMYPALDDLNYVNDPDWFYNHRIVPGMNLHFRIYCLPSIIDQALKDDEDAIVVTGHEKTRFLVEDGKLYWTQIDASSGEMMGVKNTLPFFLDKENPELIVAMTYAVIDRLDLNSLLTYDQDITFSNRTNHDKIKWLEAGGYHLTPNYFVNVASMGKTKYNFNKKSQGFINELKELGHHNFYSKMLHTHRRILNLYGDLPHAINFNGKLVKAINRYCQKVPILQDKFARWIP